MSALTFGSLFTGGGGADIGMMHAGLVPTWGVEYDGEIAEVARMNLGNHVRTLDILDATPADFPPVFAMHASPPCPNFSVAKTGAEESDNDIGLAEATAGFIAALQPQVFTLENVYQYRRSQSWKIITDALHKNGYWFDVAHVNTADFGVPQTRKRMIVRAIKGAMVPWLPEPEPWIGWYAAIEDLIPTLPDGQFAPWQLERLPEEITGAIITDARNARNMDNGSVTVVGEQEPVFTLTASNMPTRYRAFLVGNGSRSTPVEASLPFDTVTANHNQNQLRAFLVNTNQSGDEGDNVMVADDTRPAFTTKPADGGRLRAFLAPGGNANSFDIRKADEPARTVGDVKRVGNRPRAWLDSGKVVTMTPRTLARFQSFPDWYELPAKVSLACKIIGNAVPPLLMEKIYRQLVQVARRQT